MQVGTPRCIHGEHGHHASDSGPAKQHRHCILTTYRFAMGVPGACGEESHLGGSLLGAQFLHGEKSGPRSPEKRREPSYTQRCNAYSPCNSLTCSSHSSSKRSRSAAQKVLSASAFCGLESSGRPHDATRVCRKRLFTVIKHLRLTAPDAVACPARSGTFMFLAQRHPSQKKNCR